jgi:hypothetical protein
MDAHLTERALEALANDREDLAPDDARVHLESCAECRESLSRARTVSFDLGASLREDTTFDLAGLDLDALVSQVVAESAAEADLAAHSVLASGRRPVRQQSHTSLVLSLMAGLIVAALPGIVHRPELPSVGTAIDLVHLARTVFSAIDGALVSRLPGGWGLVMMVGLMLFGVLMMPARRLATRSASSHRSFLPLSALSALVLGVSLAATPSAQALDLEGEFPDTLVVSLDVQQLPTSEALRRIATSAKLGLVVTLPDDPKVTVRVQRAPLAAVLRAVLGDAPVLVKREGTMLIVRPAPSAQPAEPAGPAEPAEDEPPMVTGTQPMLPPNVNIPPVPPVPPIPGIPNVLGRRDKNGKKHRHADRVVFGGSTTVQKEEIVGDVVTIGGSATIYGTVEGDCVVMGGSVRIKKGAVVYGELVAMGGSVATEPGAIVYNGERAPPDTTAQGTDAQDDKTDKTAKKDDDDDDGDGDVDEADDDDEDDHKIAIGVHHDKDDDDDKAEKAGFLERTLEGLSKHALIFVFGLILMWAFPARLALVTRTITENPVRAGALGILGALGAVVLTVLLVITIIGIPAAIVLVLGSALALYAGLAASASVAGRYVPLDRVKGNPTRELAAGVFLLFLVSRIPVIGHIITAIAFAVGLGAIVRTRFATQMPTNSAPPPPPSSTGDVPPPESGMPGADIVPDGPPSPF